MNEGLKQLKEIAKSEPKKAISEKTGLSLGAVYRYIAGKNHPGRKAISAFEKTYGIPISAWEDDSKKSVEVPVCPVLRIREGLQLVESDDSLGACVKCVLWGINDCRAALRILTGQDCPGHIIVQTGEWCPATPENTVPCDTVRRVERPDLHFTVVTLLKESTTFHSKAVLAPIGEPGDDILVDLKNFEVYKEL